MKIVLKKRDIVVTVIAMIGMCFFISGMWEYYNVKIALENLWRYDCENDKAAQ